MSLCKKKRSQTNISSLFVIRHSTSSRSLPHSRLSHSLDFWNTNDNDDDPGETPPPLNMSAIPHEGFAKNEEWVGAQNAILSIFQGQKQSPAERSVLFNLVSRLAHSELGPFIYDYYRNQLMPRGMRILRQDVLSNSEGHLQGLEEVWNNFYKEMLSDLKVALRPIAIKEHNIRQLTLLGFRDLVLLKTEIEDMFKEQTDLHVSPAIQQMLLVLQSERISNLPSENYIRLERLVGRVVVPYLGYLGLYEGSPEPSIRSENYGTVLQKAKNVTDELSLSRVPSLNQKRQPRLKSNGKPLTLETVSEMTHHEKELLARQLLVETRQLRASSDGGQLFSAVETRRYSCDILM